MGFNDIHCLYSDTDNIVIVFHININHAAMPVELLKCSSFACEDFDLESYQIKPMHHIKDIILATVYTYTKFNKLDPAKMTALPSPSLSSLRFTQPSAKQNAGREHFPHPHDSQ